MHISISCTVAILAQGTLSGRCVRRRPFWVRFRLRRFFILRSILSYSFFCLRLRVYRVLLSQRPRCSTSCPRKPRLHYSCQRPYRVECTGSLPNSEVKRRRARSVPGWGTAREALRVLLAFFHTWGSLAKRSSGGTLQTCAKRNRGPSNLHATWTLLHIHLHIHTPNEPGGPTLLHIHLHWHPPVIFADHKD